MTTACALDIHALEAQLRLDASAAQLLDTVLPVEPASKPTGMFTSDCCGSNNYEEREN